MKHPPINFQLLKPAALSLYHSFLEAERKQMEQAMANSLVQSQSPSSVAGAGSGGSGGGDVKTAAPTPTSTSAGSGGGAAGVSDGSSSALSSPAPSPHPKPQSPSDQSSILAHFHATQHSYLTANKFNPSSALIRVFSGVDHALASSPTSGQGGADGSLSAGGQPYQQLSGAQLAAEKFKRQLSDGTTALASAATMQQLAAQNGASPNSSNQNHQPFALILSVYRLPFTVGKYGIVQKRGVFLNAQTAFKTRFVRTMCTAGGEPVLVYSESYWSGSGSGSDAMKGSIRLTGAKIEPSNSKEGGSEQQFTVQPASKPAAGGNGGGGSQQRVYVFRARSMAERDSWVNTLQTIARGELVCVPPALELPPPPTPAPQAAPSQPAGGAAAGEIKLPPPLSAPASASQKPIELVISSPAPSASPSPAVSASPTPAVIDSSAASSPDHKSDGASQPPSIAPSPASSAASGGGGSTDTKHSHSSPLPAATLQPPPPLAAAGLIAPPPQTVASLAPPPALQPLQPPSLQPVVAAASDAKQPAPAAAPVPAQPEEESFEQSIAILSKGVEMIKMPHRGKISRTRVFIERTTPDGTPSSVRASISYVYSIRWESKSKSKAETTLLLPSSDSLVKLYTGQSVGAFKDNSKETKALANEKRGSFSVVHPKRSLDLICCGASTPIGGGSGTEQQKEAEYQRWMRVFKRLIIAAAKPSK